MEIAFSSKKSIILGVLIFFLCFASLFFLSAVNILPESFFSFEFEFLLDAIFSWNSLFFVLFLAITISLVGFIFVKENFFESIIAGILPFCLALFLGIFIFGLADYLIPAIFVVLGLFLFSFLLFRDEDWVEKRKVKDFGGFLQKTIYVGAFGFLVFGFFVLQPINDDLFDDFMSQITDMALGDNLLQETTSSLLADLSIQNQLIILNTIEVNSSYSDLRNSDSVESTNFVSFFNSLKQKINSEEYKDDLYSTYEVGIGVVEDSVNMEDMLYESVPFFKVLNEWIWVLYSVLLFGISVFFGGIILKNISLLFLAIIKKVAPVEY